MSNSEDSNSETDIEELLDADDADFQKNLEKETVKVKKSNRPKIITNEKIRSIGKSNLTATPEFACYAAKKLTENLEKQIKFTKISSLEDDVESNVEDSGEGGIKLFSSSRNFISCSEPVFIQLEKPDILKHSRRRSALKQADVDDSSDDDQEKLASVAVSAEWVMSQANK